MKKPSPRGHKALSDAIVQGGPGVQMLLNNVPRRMVQRHANGDRPSTRYAYAYEVAFGIPLSAWQTKADLKALGKTQRDVDEDFERLKSDDVSIARRMARDVRALIATMPAEDAARLAPKTAEIEASLAALAALAQGIPTKPTKPLYDVGENVLVHDHIEDGKKRTRTAKVVGVNGDNRELQFSHPGGVYTLETWTVDQIGRPI